MPPLDAWPLAYVYWLVPLLFGLHNAEETPRMAQWARAVEARFMSRVSTPQFTVAVALLTVVVTLITLACVRLAPPRWNVPVMTGIQAVVFVNAISHVGASYPALPALQSGAGDGRAAESAIFARVFPADACVGPSVMGRPAHGRGPRPCSDGGPRPRGARSRTRDSALHMPPALAGPKPVAPPVCSLYTFGPASSMTSSHFPL